MKSKVPTSSIRFAMVTTLMKYFVFPGKDLKDESDRIPKRKEEDHKTRRVS